MSMNIHAKKGDKKHQFNEGDGCLASTPMHVAELQAAAEKNGYKLYKSSYDSYFDYFGISKGQFVQCKKSAIHNEIPYNDLLLLIKCKEEPTLEQQITDYKNQDESIAFIAVEDNRILLKVDSKGFISIDGQVVGHEPGVPKYFKQDLTNSGFNPNEPFECSEDGIDWLSLKSEEYCFFDKKRNQHVLYDVNDREYIRSKHVRNVKKNEFSQGQEVWGRNKTSEVWLFGTFEVTKCGSLVINHQNQCPIEVAEIRPFFVDGVATYPPFS